MIDRRVISTKGKVLEESAIQEFKASLRGELIRPEDKDYDIVRNIWNGMFQEILDPIAPPGLLVYWKSGYLANLDDEAKFSNSQCLEYSSYELFQPQPEYKTDKDINKNS